MRAVAGARTTHYKSFVVGSGLGLARASGLRRHLLITGFFLLGGHGIKKLPVSRKSTCSSRSAFKITLASAGCNVADEIQKRFYLWGFGRHQARELHNEARKHIDESRLALQGGAKKARVRLKTINQSANDFCIEASASFVSCLMNLFVQVGRHTQSGADVVVLGHEVNSTRRLQNGVDTKMKPIYINQTASI